MPATNSREIPAPNTAESLGVAPLTGYRHDLQALRGLAVLAVVAYHAKLPLPGGFIGVDIFFVISGFVIGRILLLNFSSTGSMQGREFYLKRARRLLPALALMLIFVGITSPFFGPIGALNSTAGTGVAASLFSANIFLYIVNSGGYFATAAEFNPLLHTWSLSVEEQFYFVLPAILLLGWRWGRNHLRPLQKLRVTVVLILCISFFASIFLTYASSTGPIAGDRFAFFSPVTRAWEFAVGIALVLIPVRWLIRGQVLRLALNIFGLLLISFALLAFKSGMTFPGFAALVPVLGTALVIYAGTLAVHRPLDSSWVAILRPVTWLGDLSYSWYLWHWPLIVFTGAFWLDVGNYPLWIAAVLSLFPAYFSFKYVETSPKIRNRLNPSSTILLTAACILLPIFVTMFGLRITSPFIANQDTVAEYAHSIRQHAGRDQCHSYVPLDERPPEECRWGAIGGGTSVLLIGNSNAAHFNEAFIGAASRNGVELQVATASACSFIDGGETSVTGILSSDECDAFVSRSLQFLLKNPPSLVVISNGVTDIAPKLLPEYRVRLESVIKQLQAVGSHVAIINSVPRPPTGWDSRQCSRLAILIDASLCMHKSFDLRSQGNLTAVNSLETKIARDLGVESWDFNAALCPEFRCAAISNGSIVWQDYSHISVPASEALVDSASTYLANAVDRR